MTERNAEPLRPAQYCYDVMPQAAPMRARLQVSARREERNRVVKADQGDQLEDLLNTKSRCERFPEFPGDIRRVVQLIHQPDQQQLLAAPRRVIGVAAYGRANLRGR